MSDTIWKWARRTAETITMDGQPLDLEHLVALNEAVATLVHERLPGKVFSDTLPGDAVCRCIPVPARVITNDGVCLACGGRYRPAGQEGKQP